ncbi:MAG: hypothetical protein OEW58_03290 [Gammaproteobacteria bacterium]|nr:hypothetical protein [Gammaproteobacteria bacterium]
MQQLNEIEQDLLAELFNLGMGRAAKSLSILAKQPVQSSIPRITLEPHQSFIQNLHNTSMMCCVSQEVRGFFNTNSMLFFPKEQSYELVRLMLNQDFAREMLVALHEDAITEIGNVIINACIGTISNYLKTSFDIDMPVLTYDGPEKFLDDSVKNGVLLNVGIELSLQHSNITGYLLFAFGPFSIGDLKQALGNTVLKMAPSLVSNV